MNNLDLLPGPAIRSGLYRWLSPLRAVDVGRHVTALGWTYFYLDGRRARDKRSFLETAADAMSFPPYFGHNWDAFEECVNDLSWAPAPGYVLLYDHVWWFACEHALDWQVARSIMTDACTQWAEHGTRFIVLLRNTHGCSGVADMLPPDW